VTESPFVNVAVRRINKTRLTLMANREGRTIAGLLAILINDRWSKNYASGSDPK
jgi:hypothetical protein